MYKPYYKYNGPTISQPFREELNADEVKKKIELFFNEISHYFTDVEATIAPLDNGVIGINSEISQDECDFRVKRCLNSLDLFANKLSKQ